MKVGKMQHRVTFQRPTTENDRLAGYKDEWFDVATVWAQISPVSGREYLAQIRETMVSHKIYCRYLAGVTPRMRILFKDRIFRIVSVLNWDEKNVGLTIMCEELV